MKRSLGELPLVLMFGLYTLVGLVSAAIPFELAWLYYWLRFS